MNKITIKNYILKITRVLMMGVILNVLMFAKTLEVHAKEPVIVVIDPGHGGENLGAEYEEYTEKDMTMIVAKAMKEELEKYDDVIVYLTHESADDDMTLEERALFAKEKNADFLFCLHFNMSVNHNLFGAEVWVSAFREYYAKGYAYSEILMEQLIDLGLYSRGIKTKLNDSGDNYYGILRHCTNEGIPAALIEHCHLDQVNDKPFYNQSDEQLKQFGRMDADAAARYFRLTSSELGKDYSNYQIPDIAIPQNPVKPDKTEPDISELELIEINEETGEITLKLYAEDYDSYILYYNYSLNGGNTYSDLERFEKDSRHITFTIKVPWDTELELRANVYNGFDVWTESNVIEIPAIPAPVSEEVLPQPAVQEEYEEIILEDVSDQAGEQQEASAGDSFSIWLAVVISLMILCFLILLSRLVLWSKSTRQVKE